MKHEGGRKKKKPGSYLLSHLISSIIGVRELDFRVRDGNGYCLSTMATGRYKQNKRTRRASPRGSVEQGKGEREGGAADNMVKPHDLLVLLG